MRPLEWPSTIGVANTRSAYGSCDSHRPSDMLSSRRRTKAFNSRLCDELLNDHWFTSLHPALTIIRAWIRAYNQERPKRAFGVLRPAAYARQFTAKTVTFTPGL